MRHTRIIVSHYGGPEELRVVEEKCPEPKQGGSTTIVTARNHEVRFALKTRHSWTASECRSRARRRHMQCSKEPDYSMASSVCASNVGEIVRPSALPQRGVASRFQIELSRSSGCSCATSLDTCQNE